jgi:hypothetical protein
VLLVIRVIYLQSATIGNRDRLPWFPHFGSIGFNFSHDIHSVGNLSKHAVLSIQPRRLSCANEELTSVGVGSYILMAKDDCCEEKSIQSRLSVWYLALVRYSRVRKRMEDPPATLYLPAFAIERVPVKTSKTRTLKSELNKQKKEALIAYHLTYLVHRGQCQSFRPRRYDRKWIFRQFHCRW